MLVLKEERDQRWVESFLGPFLLKVDLHCIPVIQLTRRISLTDPQLSSAPEEASGLCTT